MTWSTTARKSITAPPPAPAPPPPGEPERHVHGTIHRDSHSQRRAGLFPLAYRGIQRTQAVVAVGLERAHAEFAGQGEGLVVMGFGLLNFWRIAMYCNLAEEA